MPRAARPTASGDERHDADELRLWCRARDGEAEAKQQLLGIVTAASRAYCARKQLLRPEAEEVESRVVLSILELLTGTGSPPTSSLRGWLRYRIWAVTKDYFRERQKVRALAPLLDDSGGPSQPGTVWADPAEQREVGEALAHCLGQLPEPQRQAIMHRYGNNETVAQASAHLASTNPNTIRVWIYRGITALRSCLVRRGFDS